MGLNLDGIEKLRWGQVSFIFEERQKKQGNHNLRCIHYYSDLKIVNLSQILVKHMNLTITRWRQTEYCSSGGLFNNFHWVWGE